jgi:hypothetical protein
MAVFFGRWPFRQVRLAQQEHPCLFAREGLLPRLCFGPGHHVSTELELKQRHGDAAGERRTAGH